MEFLQEHSVKEITDHDVKQITPDGVDLVDNATGDAVSLEADVVVLALGSAPMRGLAEALEEQGLSFHIIGDCNRPNNIKQAIYEGARVGRQV
jgi:hypothetical protein